MAACDRATDQEAANFADRKAKILASTRAWSLESKNYLEAVLDQLEMMTAYYSYGNGEIVIEDDSRWNTLDPQIIIPMVNRAIKPDLNIEVSEDCNKFPTVLWFEMGGLMDDPDYEVEE
jgi:hypothetical protein